MTIRFPYIGLDLTYIGKTVRVFGLDISYYGILTALGLCLALVFVTLEAKRNRMNINHYLNAVILSLILGVVGARLFYVAFYWNLYKSDSGKILDIRLGGMAYFGALLGCVIALKIISVIQKESFSKLADIFSLGALIAQAIGRWGDFFNRGSFGEYTEWPLAMQLPLSAVHSGEVTVLMRENLVVSGDSTYIQCHPAFLYESLWCLLLLLFLLIKRRKKLFDGEIFLRYLAWYGFGRFFLEAVRTDSIMIPGTGIPIGMVISMALFFVCMPIVSIKGIMTRKRVEHRRRRRERALEIEEEAAKARQEQEIQRKIRTALAEAEEPSADAEKVKYTFLEEPEETDASEAIGLSFVEDELEGEEVLYRHTVLEHAPAETQPALPPEEEVSQEGQGEAAILLEAEQEEAPASLPDMDEETRTFTFGDLLNSQNN